MEVYILIQLYHLSYSSVSKKEARRESLPHLHTYIIKLVRHKLKLMSNVWLL